MGIMFRLGLITLAAAAYATELRLALRTDPGTLDPLLWPNQARLLRWTVAVVGCAPLDRWCRWLVSSLLLLPSLANARR